jgi:hypothetical protein
MTLAFFIIVPFCRFCLSLLFVATVCHSVGISKSRFGYYATQRFLLNDKQKRQTEATNRSKRTVRQKKSKLKVYITFKTMTHEKASQIYRRHCR